MEDRLCQNHQFKKKKDEGGVRLYPFMPPPPTHTHTLPVVILLLSTSCNFVQSYRAVPRGVPMVPEPPSVFI